jgi:hypothetical protein
MVQSRTVSEEFEKDYFHYRFRSRLNLIDHFQDFQSSDSAAVR